MEAILISLIMVQLVEWIYSIILLKLMPNSLLKHMNEKLWSIGLPDLLKIVIQYIYIYILFNYLNHLLALNYLKQ